VLPISAINSTIGTLVPLIIFGVATISVFLKLAASIFGLHDK